MSDLLSFVDSKSHHDIQILITASVWIEYEHCRHRHVVSEYNEDLGT